MSQLFLGLPAVQLQLHFLLPQIPHVKIGPEETPKLPYLRFASVTLHPSNEDLSLAIGSILRSFGYPTTSIICAKAECEFAVSIQHLGLSFLFKQAYGGGVASVATPPSIGGEVLSCTSVPSGLLRLEELVQSFLISRETLSVRMLDESLDPTPLLKEIRDDKVATIIIDANASVSYRILKKVRLTIEILSCSRSPLEF